MSDQYSHRVETLFVLVWSLARRIVVMVCSWGRHWFHFRHFSRAALVTQLIATVFWTASWSIFTHLDPMLRIQFDPVWRDRSLWYPSYIFGSQQLSCKEAVQWKLNQLLQRVVRIGRVHRVLFNRIWIFLEVFSALYLSGMLHGYNEVGKPVLILSHWRLAAVEELHLQGPALVEWSPRWTGAT